MKNIYDTLDRAGVSLPSWVFIVILIMLIISGCIVIYNKYLKKFFKQIVKIEENIQSIDAIKDKQTELETAIKNNYNLNIEYNKRVEERINKFENTLESITTSLKSITDFNVEWKQTNKVQNDALKMMLCNELDKKYRRFLDLGYIPDGEFEEYVSMHDAYNGIGGNHTGDAKYKYVIEHLERKV